MMFSRTLLALATTLALGSAQAIALTPPALPAPLPVFYTGPILSGQTLLIDFTLSGTATSGSFISKISPPAGSPTAPSTFELYSGSTLIGTTLPATGVFSLTTQYAGLTLGNPYTLKVSSALAGPLEIRSGFLGSNLQVTAVPEPAALALALCGLGVAGVALRRRSA